MEEQAKQAAGEEAAREVESGMLVGLGTGTTAAFAIHALAKRCREGLKIQALPSSEATYQLAHSLGIPLINPQTVKHLDLTLDGADAIDPKLQMIKGGGGALLREKIVSTMSSQMIAVVDATKWRDTLGPGRLPVEVIPFGAAATTQAIEALGYTGQFRPHFATDQGNWIFDLHLPTPLKDPSRLHAALLSIPGVVETGLFLGIAKAVIIGYPDGSCKKLGPSLTDQK